MLTAAIIGVLAVIWALVPMFAAAGKALDHPAWSPSVGSASDLEVDQTSWWPPGRRYEWLSSEPEGRREVAIDPWDRTAEGHGWTASVVAVAAGSLLWLHRGRFRRDRQSLPAADPG
jgi:hypothetical protein